MGSTQQALTFHIRRLEMSQNKDEYMQYPPDQIKFQKVQQGKKKTRHRNLRRSHIGGPEEGHQSAKESEEEWAEDEKKNKESMNQRCKGRRVKQGGMTIQVKLCSES